MIADRIEITAAPPHMVCDQRGCSQEAEFTVIEVNDEDDRDYDGSSVCCPRHVLDEVRGALNIPLNIARAAFHPSSPAPIMGQADIAGPAGRSQG